MTPPPDWMVWVLAALLAGQGVYGLVAGRLRVGFPISFGHGHGHRHHPHDDDRYRMPSSVVTGPMVRWLAIGLLVAAALTLFHFVAGLMAGAGVQGIGWFLGDVEARRE